MSDLINKLLGLLYLILYHKTVNYYRFQWDNISLKTRLKTCMGLAGHGLPMSVIAPANTTHCNNDVLMLAQRLRRWPNIKTSLLQCVVFAGRVVGNDAV